MYNFSPVETTPYRSKLPHIPDYRSLPVSASRRRKIEHVRNRLKAGEPKGRVLHHAIHNMRMFGNDIVEAMSE